MRLGRFSGAMLAKVLAFILASGVLTVALAVKIANFDLFRDRYEVQAEFTNASGVFEGDPVKLAGVDVGRVTSTEIENGKAVVTFDLDRSVPLTTESRVGIRWRNVVGLRFLYLYPGDGGGTPVEDGDRIPVSRTDTAGDIGEFLNSLGPILKAIDPEKANAFLDAMNTALAGNEATVQALLSEGSTLASDLGNMDQEIEELISSSDTVMGAYARQSDSIGSIIDDLDVVGGRLAGMTEEINDLVVNFAVVQQEMDRLLRENRSNIDSSLQSLSSVARNLALHRKDLARTLCTLPAGVAPYYQTSSWGEWFNVRIGEFVVKDRRGHVITRQSEGPDARASQAPPVMECPRGTPVAVLTRGSGEPGPVELMGLAQFVESVAGGDRRG